MKSRFAALSACTAVLLTAGLAVAQPANDICGQNQAGFTIPANGGSVTQAVTGAIRDGAACTGSTGVDVYYYWTPSSAGPWQLQTCATAVSFDSVLSIHTGCPTSTGNFVTGSATGSCDDDSCGVLSRFTIASITPNPATPYVIRIGRFSGATAFTYTLDVLNLSSSGACCSPTTAVCTLVAGAANCASGNNYQGNGTLCVPNPCPPPPPPANDTCATAQIVTLNSPVSGNNQFATTDFDDIHSCITTTTRGVWFAFTAAVTSAYNIDSFGSTFDTVVSAFDSCGGAELACNDDTTGLQSRITVNINAGNSVRILLSAYSSFTTAGPYTLTVSATTAGACCNDTTGVCTTSISGASGCATGTTYQGDNTSCSPSPCPASGSCCNPDTGGCTLRIEILCASPNVWTSGNVCFPNPCPQPPAPANDECSAAVVLTLGTPAAGLVTGATGADITTCSGSNIDIWYTFTPATSGAFILTAVPNSPSDAGIALAAFDTCPPFADTNQGGAACAAQPGTGTTSTVTLSGVAGQTLYLRAAGFVGNIGAFSLTINATTSGACCNNTTGVCTISTTGATGCGTVGTYQGDNSLCAPSPCPASGSCCNPTTGGCTLRIEILCASPNVWTSGNVCSPNPCPQPPPPANDECTGAIALQLNVAVSGSNTQATGDGFEGPGGACYTTSPNNFNKGVWFTFTAPANDVYGFTACGSAFDTVLSVFDGTCAAIGSELGCDDDTCDGITPAGSGLASIIAPIALSQSQTYLVRLSSWGSGSGAFTLSATGTPVAANVMCCRGVTCAVVADAAACSAPAGIGIRVLGPAATSCAGQSAINAGCCYADFNKSGVKDVADIFAFLSAWFANSPFADVGGDGTGTRDVSDIFQFLSAWFVGCT